MSAPDVKLDQAAPVPNTDAKPEVAAWKLAMTLGVAGALAGLLLVFVDQATRPLIEEHRRRALESAIKHVLSLDLKEGSPARIVSLQVKKDRFELEEEPVFEVNADDIDRVFLGYGADGKPKGFAIVHQRPGFQDQIQVIFGYEPLKNEILSMKVLSSLETPGLGDKSEKDMVFVEQFEGKETPLNPVKPGQGVEPGDVDTISGATISSKAVIKVINLALEGGDLRGRLKAWMESQPTSGEEVGR